MIRRHREVNIVHSHRFFFIKIAIWIYLKIFLCVLLSDAFLWKCAYCPSALSSEQDLQQHMSSEHVSQQGSVFACAVCSLSFLSEAEFQQHFLTNHVQLIQDREGLQAHDSTSQMVTLTVIHY